MALLEVIKFDTPSDDLFVWKWRSRSSGPEGDQIRLGSQLVVNQAQEAVFVKGGQALDVFTSGTHTLSTGNLPILRRLINIPFGGDTPFTAEVWFVNKTAKRDVGWGTSGPVQVMDPEYGFPINVRAFGKWGVRIKDSRSFITQLVGTLHDTDGDRIEEYFVGEIVQRFTDRLAKYLVEQNVSLFKISARLNDLSRLTHEDISPEFERFGMEVVNFNVQRVSIPDEDMAKFQGAFGEKLRADAIGRSNMQAYAAMRSFDTLEKAASNEGTAGALLAAGLGVGIGIGAGVPAGQRLGQMITPQPAPQTPPPQPTAPPAPAPSPPAQDSPMARIQQAKQMLDMGLITQEEFAATKNEILRTLRGG